MNGWRNATRAERCPVCQGPDWCSVSDDGAWAACRRQSEGGAERVDRNHMQYWVHQLRDDVARERWEPPPAPALASPADRHRVYAALLRELHLSPEHRCALRARGLDDTAIDTAGYRTLAVRGRADLARSLAERFDRDLLLTVPGVQLRGDGDRKWLTVGGAAGLVVPARDIEGRVVALKVRCDRPLDDGNRYLYVSSTRTGGPSPGAPVHVPLWSGAAPIVRVTEGELKADVASHLSGVLTVSAAGVNSWRAVLPVLDELGADKVLLAFDSDWRTNEHVAAMVVAAGAELAQQNYAGGVELWRAGMGKGIDDVLANGGRTTVLPFGRQQELDRQRERAHDRGLERAIGP